MKLNTYLKTLFLIIGAANLSLAQTQDVDEMQDMQGNAIIVTSTADESGVMGTTVMAVESTEFSGHSILGDPMFAGAMGMDVAGGDFSLLNNASVQKDLNLVDGQLERIEEINKEFAERMQEKLAEFRDDDGNFNMKSGADFGNLISELKKQQQEEISSILLPNQQARLDQVARQMKMRQMGSEKTLTKLLAKELDLSDQQLQNIKKKSKALQQELNEKIAEMKANAKKELFSELTKDQKAKLEELIGDEFIVKDEDTKSPFRRMMMRQRSGAKDF